MDIRDLWNDPEETLRVAIEGVLKRVWTAMPCTAAQDSADGHTGIFQPAIQRAVQDPSTGQYTYEDHPTHPDVPIHYPGGGGVTSTHPVKQSTGDEGIILYASRCMDAWHQSGGSQQPMDGRMHDLADGLYIPGIRSTPRKLQNVSTVSHQTRSDDGNHFIDTHPQNGITHQSTNMVFSQVGNATAHLLTTSGVQTNGPKVAINCG